jgi:hypothetical protein
MITSFEEELQTMKPVKSRKKELRKLQSLWDEIPSLGREAMIATIGNELELIRALKAENEREYDKLYFFNRQ